MNEIVTASGLSLPEAGTVEEHKQNDTAQSVRSPATKLYPLTALRFFAAGIIVLLHSQSGVYDFGIPANAWATFDLAQGVSFFFILSGFILTYVYNSLPRSEVPRFWLARIARIWPAHITGFALIFLLLPLVYRSFAGGYTFPIAIANLFLVQTWIPRQTYWTSFNSVTWSLSVEFAFYLLFPLFIRRFRQTWILLLIATATLALGPLFYLRDQVLRAWVIASPVGRMFEFVLGMTVALAWIYLGPKIRIGYWVATVVEAITLVIVYFSMSHTVIWANQLNRGDGFFAWTNFWFISTGFTCIPFALLIFVMALGKGLIARLLSLPLLVLLGEISYSIYMLHGIILFYFGSHPIVFAHLPNWLALLIYWAATILAAYAVWTLIEVPTRRCILHLARRDKTAKVGAGTGERRPKRSSAITSSWRLGLVAAIVLIVPLAYALHLTAAPSLDHLTRTDKGIRYSIDCVGMGCMTGTPPPKDGPVIVSRGQFPQGMPVRGWAMNDVQHRLVRGVYISVDDTKNYWAIYGISRLGYSTYFGSQELGHAGFDGYIPVSHLSPGDHTVTIKIVSWDSSTFFESRKFGLAVT